MIDTPEHGILSWLSKAWSDDQSVSFQWINESGFHADTVKRVIYAANIGNKQIHGKLTGFKRWRLWRFCTFHESDHQKFSPRNSPDKYVANIADNYDAYSKIKLDEKAMVLATTFFKILEDRRIDTLGLQTYVGYIPEKLFLNAYTWLKFKQDFDRAERNIKRGHTLRFTLNCLAECAMSRVLWNQVPSPVIEDFVFTDLSKTSTPAISKSPDDIKKAFLTMTDCKDLSAECAARAALDFVVFIWETCDVNKLSGKMDTGTKNNPNGKGDVLFLVGVPDSPLENIPPSPVSDKKLQGVMVDLGFHITDAKNSVKGSESLKAEFKELAKQALQQTLNDIAQKVTEEVNKNSGLSEHTLTFGKSSANTVLEIPQPTAEKWNNLIEPVIPQINELKNKLKSWRAQWKEVLDIEGEDIDVEAYIACKSSNQTLRQAKIFLDEQRTSPKGRIAIMVDMSGSISTLFTKYLQAAAIICEGLDYVKAKFEIYIFQTRAEYGSSNITWLIKAVEEKWGIEQKNRLAMMHSMGSTPMIECTRLVAPRIVKSDLGRYLIITDGAPNGGTSGVSGMQALLSKLEHKGIKSYFIGISTVRKDNMQAMLGNKHDNRVRHCDGVDEIPSAFFSLLTET